ncbi:MAG: helix-turn-helix transcriptional regulator [Alphaproteobacteria bacterium]|nr:helix-turn-helix transcriptional regulator [Rickettsiales bacterium]
MHNKETKKGLNPSAVERRGNSEDWFDHKTSKSHPAILHQSKYKTELQEVCDVTCNTKIGERIRNIRLLLGFTQSAFSNLMNVTFQQIQKYEKGLNRVSAIALWDLSEKLGVDISYFFPGINKDKNVKKVSMVSEKLFSFDFDKRDSGKNDQIKEILLLLNEFNKLKKAKIRKKVISLIQTIAESESENA